MKDDFFISIETMHCADRGDQENVHELPPEKLRIREVEYIDIGNDPVAPKDYKETEDPSKFKSEKTGRGSLTGNWRDTVNPVMCAYKLVTVEFKWFGLQTKVESFIQSAEQRLFLKFHREVFCWIDQWYGLTMADIRRMEEETKNALQAQIAEGEIRGTLVEE
ncbi:Phosphatidylinositol transfer protein alpha isoform, partial [Stegodyphus mimosarum]